MANAFRNPDDNRVYELTNLVLNLDRYAQLVLANPDAIDYGKRTYTERAAYHRCFAKHNDITTYQSAAVHAAASTDRAPKFETEYAQRWIQTRIFSGHYPAILDKARYILESAAHTLYDVASSDARKIIAYALASSGDLGSAVIDRWMHRAATASERDGVPTGKRYDLCAEALTIIATRYGWNVADMQAAIWYIINPKPDMHTPKPCADCEDN